MIIPMIIPTTGLLASGSGQVGSAPDVSRPFPSGPVQSDGDHCLVIEKVVGSTPTSGSTTPQVRGSVSASIECSPGPFIGKRRPPGR